MNVWIGLAVLAAVCLTTAFAAVRRFFVVVRVTGTSMLPAFGPQDRVLVRRGTGTRMRAGAVAVLAEPRDVLSWRLTSPATPALGEVTWVIKRIAAVPGDAVPESVRAAASRADVVPDGMLVVLSDNPEGNDSRRWGFIPASRVLGPVVLRIPVQPAS
ncbi:MAG: S26 family signal peptidase [Streptosporangiaceae bacterium]|jgi:signal peptidase I